MSDISLRFSPLDLLVIAYALAMPVLAGLVLAARAVTVPGRVRLLALAGLGCLAVLVADVALVRDGVLHDGVGTFGRGALLAGLGAAWLATALRADASRWMDAAVVAGPALLGAIAIWFEHG